MGISLTATGLAAGCPKSYYFIVHSKDSIQKSMESGTGVGLTLDIMTSSLEEKQNNTIR